MNIYVPSWFGQLYLRCKFYFVCFLFLGFFPAVLPRLHSYKQLVQSVIIINIITIIIIKAV